MAEAFALREETAHRASSSCDSERGRWRTMCCCARSNSVTTGGASGDSPSSTYPTAATTTSLVDDGFPLLPTLDSPHWTVVLAAATAAQFDRVRLHFEGPISNPSYRARDR